MEASELLPGKHTLYCQGAIHHTHNTEVEIEGSPVSQHTAWHEALAALEAAVYNNDPADYFYIITASGKKFNHRKPQ